LKELQPFIFLKEPELTIIENCIRFYFKVKSKKNPAKAGFFLLTNFL